MKLGQNCESLWGRAEKISSGICSECLGSLSLATAFLCDPGKLFPSLGLSSSICKVGKGSCGPNCRPFPGSFASPLGGAWGQSGEGMKNEVDGLVGEEVETNGETKVFVFLEELCISAFPAICVHHYQLIQRQMSFPLFKILKREGWQNGSI